MHFEIGDHTKTINVICLTVRKMNKVRKIISRIWTAISVASYTKKSERRRLFIFRFFSLCTLPFAFICLLHLSICLYKNVTTFEHKHDGRKKIFVVVNCIQKINRRACINCCIEWQVIRNTIQVKIVSIRMSEIWNDKTIKVCVLLLYSPARTISTAHCCCCQIRKVRKWSKTYN